MCCTAPQVQSPASSVAWKTLTHASKLTQTISPPSLTPFPTAGQVSPVLPCLLHTGSLANTYTAMLMAPCPLCTQHPRELCRPPCPMCGGAGTSLLREQPPAVRNEIWRLYSPASLPLSGGNSEAWPALLPSFQSSAVGWSPDSPQQPPARYHSLQWFPFLHLADFLTGAS